MSPELFSSRPSTSELFSFQLFSASPFYARNSALHRSFPVRSSHLISANPSLSQLLLDFQNVHGSFSTLLSSPQLMPAHLMSPLFSPLLTSSKLFSFSQLISAPLSLSHLISALLSAFSDHLSPSLSQDRLHFQPSTSSTAQGGGGSFKIGNL